MLLNKKILILTIIIDLILKKNLIIIHLIIFIYKKTLQCIFLKVKDLIYKET